MSVVLRYLYIFVRLCCIRSLYICLNFQRLKHRTYNLHSQHHSNECTDDGLLWEVACLYFYANKIKFHEELFSVYTRKYSISVVYICGMVWWFFFWCVLYVYPDDVESCWQSAGKVNFLFWDLHFYFLFCRSSWSMLINKHTDSYFLLFLY